MAMAARQLTEATCYCTVFKTEPDISQREAAWVRGGGETESQCDRVAVMSHQDLGYQVSNPPCHGSRDVEAGILGSGGGLGLS